MVKLFVSPRLPIFNYGAESGLQQDHKGGSRRLHPIQKPAEVKNNIYNSPNLYYHIVSCTDKLCSPYPNTVGFHIQEILMMWYKT